MPTPPNTGPCPHCSVVAYWTWQSFPFWETSADGSGWTICAAMCPTCAKLVANLLYFDDAQAKVASFIATLSALASQPPPQNMVLVWPTHPTPELDPAVPEPFASDYREAAAVLPRSPKASAALARRLLQTLIRQKAAITGRTLDDEIQELLASDKGLPSHAREALDHIRITGNDAAHPNTDTAGLVIDVTEDEARWNLEALLGLFDYYFVNPAKSAQRVADLKAKQHAAGKNPNLRS